jgi:uncharacterized protein (TIGR02246 family)
MSYHDQDDIRRIFEDVYAHNVRSRDVQGYAEMYTEDALWMPPDGTDRCGIPEIVEGFEMMISQQAIDPTFTAEEIRVFDDLGYVIGYSIAIISPLDGSPSREVKYKALWLMKKEYGSWKIDRQIWNKQPL